MFVKHLLEHQGSFLHEPEEIHDEIAQCTSKKYG